MKVALLLTGGLRNYKDTFSSFKHYLLDKLNPDVFFYGLENKEGKEQNIKDFTELYNPISYSINDNEYYDNIQVNNSYIKTSYYSFYNVQQCNNLRLEYQKEQGFEYDVVIRCRLDVFWFREISQFELDKSKSELVIPKEWCFKTVHPLAVSDIFTIGNDSMTTEYANLFDYIDEYCKRCKFHPETLAGVHVHDKNIKHYLSYRHFEFYYPSKELEEKYVPKPHKFIEYFDIGKDSLRERSKHRNTF